MEKEWCGISKGFDEGWGGNVRGMGMNNGGSRMKGRINDRGLIKCW